MDEYTIVGVLVVVLIPIILALIAAVQSWNHKSVESATQMTTAVVSLKDTINELKRLIERQEGTIKDHEERIRDLEETSREYVTRMSNIEHAHEQRVNFSKIRE